MNLNGNLMKENISLIQQTHLSFVSFISQHSLSLTLSPHFEMGERKMEMNWHSHQKFNTQSAQGCYSTAIRENQS